ncbi:AKH_1a_G0051800.mRNA.1.CDS.1 [Saccharomyces cerevisiae]|nr:AKH_1a_G0051800.mRNA.1.CDS.1 [Saccharomyces cerevisiae]CAI6892328.1 AKH_1a_G0051800.mRNA.1.CDS.1 [Saccharomyces cerevisiae]
MIFNPVISNHKLSHYIHVFCTFTTFCILGTETRQAITALSTYTPAFVTAPTVLWSNCSSCMLMGIMQSLNAYTWMKDHQVLFLGVTTGYCGALSSFSSMLLEMFEHSTNLTNGNIANHTKLPNRAYGIMEFLSVLLVHLMVSMGSLIFGRQLGKEVIVAYGSSSFSKPYTPPSDTVKENAGDVDTQEMEKNILEFKFKTPAPFFKKFFDIVDKLAYALAFPLIILFVVLCAYYENYSRGKWTLPCLFGIFAGFLRYWLAEMFNKTNKKFPLSTFLANVFATLLIGIFTMVQRGKKHFSTDIPIVNSLNSCHIVSALISGFCGTLSTISTFINEGYKLSFINMLIYYTVSIAISYCLLVITLGSYAWTRGLTNPIC